jgi:T3SS (YopN, CesT) and YbjN peptide-binding chaperone 3
MIDTAWDRLTAKLSSAILGFVRGDTLILRNDRRGVQLAHVVDTVYSESVEKNLRPEQEQRLTEIGWLPPNPPGNFSYYHEISVPVSSAEAQRLARLLVQTLREIHGVDSPAELAVEAWNDETGQSLSFTIPA